MSLDQMYVMRPVAGWARYRTPIRGLYLCGSGAHPGGGVMGAPGYNCAREMLKSGMAPAEERKATSVWDSPK
jgi:phytoene dehydrogenase-like protein